MSCIALYESKLHKKRGKSLSGDFEDDELSDDEEEDETRQWAKICNEELPSMETDMDILEDLRERIKRLEQALPSGK